VRVLRVFHAGRAEAQQARELALMALGVDVTLAVPASWPGVEGSHGMRLQPFDLVELEILRAGDVNRHAYRDPALLTRLIADARPDVLDLHEEPFSVAAHQWLRAAPSDLPIVMYTAQNIDKRLPPPFVFYEERSYGRVDALYPCSRQAGAVARGKGFEGPIEVLQLGFDPTIYSPGTQSLDHEELMLGLFGRLVPEKGVQDAVQVLAFLNERRSTRLLVVGSGSEEQPARQLADALGISDRLEFMTWLPPEELAEIYRRTHVVLVPSLSTPTWAEQFGRVIVEAQASGAIVAGYASGAIPEVAGPPALLVAEGDVAALAKALLDLLREPFEFGRRREEGIALSARRTWDVVAQQQISLYRKVIDGDFERVPLPRSPRERRALAHKEFGETAPTPVGSRPFALPILRRGGAAPTVLAAALDASAEFRAFFAVRSASAEEV
jgi:glycosyltransferase involved in cell wall biosynthesis